MKNNLHPIVLAVLRKDFLSFLQKAFIEHYGMPLNMNWHIEVLVYELIRCANGEVFRLIVNMPPRSLKSFIISVAFPAWLMGRNPYERIITVSYAQDLAAKFARDQRNIIQQAWYQEVFPKTRINPRKSTENEFETTVGGFRMATSIGGVLTGRGANYIIIDDPIKAQDALSETKRKSVHEWIDNTAISRFDDKKTGVAIVTMQRVHVDDTTNYLIQKGGWTTVCLPAISQYDQELILGNGRTHYFRQGEALHPERESLAILEALKAEMGAFHFSAQYLQQPVPIEGNYLKREWFKQYDELPKSGQIVQSWDTAMTCQETSDWSVCSAWLIQGEFYYLIDIHRQRLNFPDLKRSIIELKTRFSADMVLIEESVAGISLIQDLRNNHISVLGIRPQGSKDERLMSASLTIEAGAVFLPAKAPWLDEFLNELVAYPAGRHDDQVDSVSQFLNWVKDRIQLEPMIRQL